MEERGLVFRLRFIANRLLLSLNQFLIEYLIRCD